MANRCIAAGRGGVVLTFAPGHSAIYRGAVRHGRTQDVAHRFTYRLFQVFVDLDELPELTGRGGPLAPRLLRPWRFRRQDYLPSELPLAEEARSRVERLLGERPTGAVRMLTTLRTFGYVFNPVSFYYCYDDAGGLHSVLAEITNTPWRERHCYAVRAGGAGPATASFDKEFHVSPFQPMEQRYEWEFAAPGEELSAHMRNRSRSTGAVVFTASLQASRQPLTAATMRRASFRHPWITLKVILGIHLQALRLWCKGAKFHVHPRKRPVLQAEGKSKNRKSVS